MKGILIAFPGEKTRTYMLDVLSRGGVSVDAACGTGMETVGLARKMKSGIVLAGDGLCDMDAQDLRDCLPKNFYMILLAKRESLEACQGNVVKVEAPASAQTILEAIHAVEQEIAQKAASIPQRSDEDKQLIAKAKQQIMDNRTISEEDAYRLIQRASMNMGFKMAYTAREILMGNLVI